jgi:hypothetical protein
VERHAAASGAAVQPKKKKGPNEMVSEGGKYIPLLVRTLD